MKYTPLPFSLSTLLSPQHRGPPTANDSVVVASVAMNFLLIRDEWWGGRGELKEPSHFKFLARSNAHVTVKDS